MKSQFFVCGWGLGMFSCCVDVCRLELGCKCRVDVLCVCVRACAHARVCACARSHARMGRGMSTHIYDLQSG